jgi:phage baseplate assembly protein gpV
MRNLAAIEARRMRNALEAAERRIALMHLPGKVSEHKDPDKRLLRLKLGETPDGEPILGPWSRWQEAGAGGLNIHSEPATGEQMILTSFSGTVGGASIAMPATYDKDHEAPSKSSDTAVMERGQGRIEIGADGILIKGPIRMDGTVDISGGRLTHNDKNVGSDHGHVSAPPGVPGPPV